MMSDIDDAVAGVMQGQATAIRNNIASAVTQNPATVTQHAKLAGALGVPLESVQADPATAKQQAALQSFDAQKVVTQYPHLAQFLTDPVNAAKAHTDLPTLAATEQAVKSLPQPAPATAAPTFEGNPPGLLTDAWTGVKSTANKVFGAWDKTAVALNDLMPDGTPGKMAPDERAAYLARGTASQGAAIANGPQRWTGQVTGGLSYLPFLGAAPFVVGATEGTAASQQLQQQGVAPATANATGAVEGGLLGLAQLIPMGHLLFGQGAGALAKSAASATLKAGAVGAGQSVVSDSAVSQILKTQGYGHVADQYAPSIDKAWDSALFMAALHLGSQAGTAGASWAINRPPVPPEIVNGTVKADQATQGMQGLQALGELSAKAELRKNDPQAFNDFVQKVADDGHLPEVWIDGKTLTDALNQSGIPLAELEAKLPDVAAQLHEAMQTNGDVRIKTADYATSIAGGPLEKAFLPHLKTDPDGMTFSQGQEHLAGQQADMMAQAKALTEEQVQRNERTQQLKTITDDVQGQLEATGRFPSDVAKQYAALHGAFYDNMSERMGISPEEMRARMPLSIQGEGQGGLSQGNRGFYDPATGQMGLLKDADLSTFLHESGHFFLESMHDLTKSPEAPQGIKDDFDKLLTSFRVGGATPEERAADWAGRTLDEKREGHEQFAEGFENYLMTGKAPVPELQSMFSRFRSWLMNVYTSMRGEVSPEVRGVMDRMFASQEAITEAERVRAYAIPDLPGEHGSLIDEYKTLGKEATEQAIADMQARSMRDLKWASNAKSKALRELQRTAKDERATITDEVTKEVMSTPVHQARDFIKTGRMDVKDLTNAERKTLEQASGMKTKLNLGDLKEMYGTDPAAPWRYLDGLTGKEGLHPDLVADIFGFDSGKSLVKALLAEGNPAETISGMTDQRMLERHGDLIDPVSVERAAEAAFHNAVRAKMIATGLKMFTKSPMSVLEINKAAKAAADTAIAQKAVGDLRPAQYSAAEAKANKELLKLAPKDPMGAAQAQRAALLNNRLFKSASEAVSDVRAGLVYLKRFSRDSVRGKIDVDVCDQIDGLLARFDLRANPTDKPTRAQLNLEKWIDSQAAAGYSPTVTPEMLAPEFKKPYRDLSVEQFRGMVDTIKSMEHMGKERNSLTINGVKKSLSDYVTNELVPKLQERGDRFSTDEIYTKVEDRGVGKMATVLDHLSSWLRGINAQLKPQEFKRNDYDRHELTGPFGEALFDPVVNANYNKVRMLKGLSDDFRVKAGELGRDWQKSLHDMLPNDKLIDAIATKEAGQPIYMKMSRGKMVGLAIHVGNESNFDKLTKGYGWEPEKVWGFLHENMTAKDWDAVQHVWELYEKHWPDMQAMYKRLGQTTPDKIEPRAFHTPFGEIAGGYAAIKYDPLRSRRGERDAAGAAIDPGKGLFGADYFSRTATTNGSMNKRMDGYTDAIDLNFHTIERSLQESIHDLAYRESLINANKIVEHPDFRKAFFKAYGREDHEALQTWIGRIANSANSDREVGAMGRFLQYTRTGMVMNAIALRATTVLKHGGSADIKTVGYFLGGGERYLASRFASMASDYTNQITGDKEKFGEINTRLLQTDRDYRATASSMFEPESLQSKAERFGHSAVAWADMMSAVPTAWAAYDRAITEGIPVRQGGTGAPMTEAQAVSYANKIVREAHGSNVEAARSNIMTAPSEGLKMLTTLYGFMNNSYGQMADSINKFQTPGIGKPEIVARTLMAIVVPALWAGYLSEGGAKNDESWGAWAGKAITGEVAGMVPVVRDAFSMVQGFRHAGVIGVESWMQTLVQPVLDAGKAATGHNAPGAVSHLADAVGMGLHIPGLGQIGKSAQYAADVASGKQHPANAAEYAKGMVVGAPKK